MAESRAPSGRATRDPCVVPTEPLAHLLQRYVADWQRERPPTAGRFTEGATRTEVAPMNALAALEEEIARTAARAEAHGAVACRVPLRSLQAIKAQRWRTTELRVADAIVEALGRPDLFHDGTLNVIARSSGCSACGGSGNTLLGTL